MAKGEKIKCPYCDCKVLVSEVEKNDGLCPECQQMISSSSNLFDDYDDDEDDLDLEDQELSEYDEDEDDFDDDDDDYEDDEDYDEEDEDYDEEDDEDDR
jgi:acetyl-CoA carboxylase beta subunit